MSISDDDNALNEAADMVGRIRAILNSHSQLQDMNIELTALSYDFNQQVVNRIRLSLNVTPKDGYHGYRS